MKYYFHILVSLPRQDAFVLLSETNLWRSVTRACVKVNSYLLMPFLRSIRIILLLFRYWLFCVTKVHFIFSNTAYWALSENTPAYIISCNEYAILLTLSPHLLLFHSATLLHYLWRLDYRSNDQLKVLPFTRNASFCTCLCLWSRYFHSKWRWFENSSYSSASIPTFSVFFLPNTEVKKGRGSTSTIQFVLMNWCLTSTRGNLKFT